MFKDCVALWLLTKFSPSLCTLVELQGSVVDSRHLLPTACARTAQRSAATYRLWVCVPRPGDVLSNHIDLSSCLLKLMLFAQARTYYPRFVRLFGKRGN